MPSVKEFQVRQKPTPNETGYGSFFFTDDYSVFDWGKMPDPIPQKGASLNLMGAHNFERMKDQGIPNHYKGVVVDGEVVSVEEAHQLLEEGEAPNRMAIELVNSPELMGVDLEEGNPESYQQYFQQAGNNYVIPLEIVFRNTIGETSSFRGRNEPADVGLDYEEWPDRGLHLSKPVVEFSTKFEEQDDYMDELEYRDVTDFLPSEISPTELRSIANSVNSLITERAEELGMEHVDGKIECACIEGDIVVVDVAGTLDENRFTHEGTPVSKRFLRDQCRGTGWHNRVKEAKDGESENWKQEVEVEPPELKPKIVRVAADIYKSAANEWTGREFFPDAPGIEGALQRREEVV